MSHVKGLLQVNAWQTTHTQLSLLVHDFSVNLSLYLCSYSSLAALLSACGTPTCVNVSATRSRLGFPQDGAVLEMIRVHVRKREEGRMRKGKRGETLNVFLGEGQEERIGEELECLEGAKAVTDCHSMYS